MAAYGALVSLMHIIEQIQHHPRPPITLDQEQAQSLTEKVAFLQGFLEAYNSHGDDPEVERLKSQILDAAYAAEDIIESHVVDQILAQSTTRAGEKMSSVDMYQDLQKVGDKEYKGLKKIIRYIIDSHRRQSIESQRQSTSHDRRKISTVDFYQCLQKVIEDMDLIKKDVMEIKDNIGIQDQLHRTIKAPVVSSTSPSTEQNSTMVGFDDVLYEIMDKLTGQGSSRQIIPVVGMGGIGKTTLARNVYTHPLTEHRFDICVWVTISQEYSIREILVEVLSCQKNLRNKESLSQKTEQDLRLQLHKSLSGRRYLIIMDDMWDVEVWDKIKFCFPNNNNGSRIVVTTRLSKLALHLTCDYSLTLNFLNEDKSWELFCTNVFGKEGCPAELEKIGKKIVKNCEGLPLSIVVIGGLLAKSDRTPKYWEYVAEHLNSIVSLEDDARCLEILYSSYNLLPVQLKPCFLYMGIFPEDREIRVSHLIKRWVAEGFLKPISGKNLEMVAEEYLKDLIDRNLVLVQKWGSLSGKIKFCSMHDLLRELCLREALKEKFFCVISHHSPRIPHTGIKIPRRIVINARYLASPMSRYATGMSPYAIDDELGYALVTGSSAARSLINLSQTDLPLAQLRLLRVLDMIDNYFLNGSQKNYSLEAIFQLVSSRYLAIVANPESRHLIFPSSVHLLWNLQTLIVKRWYLFETCDAPSNIWKLSQLRHVKIEKLSLPNPPSGHMDKRGDFVLGNLLTLSNVYNFKCGEEVVKRIPNVKKLKITYECEDGFEVASHYFLNNLDRLHNLESLRCFFSPYRMPSRTDLLQNLTFPHSLKKLSLKYGGLHWKDMSKKIGPLPLLQVLKLGWQSFIGPKWETVEGQFLSLKYLLISSGRDLEYWVAESTHFPRLEHLVLQNLTKLKEIPQGIGGIPTLQSIQLDDCSNSSVISAERILEEQEEVGNEDLQVRVNDWMSIDNNLEGLKLRTSENIFNF